MEGSWGGGGGCTVGPPGSLTNCFTLLLRVDPLRYFSTFSVNDKMSLKHSSFVKEVPDADESQVDFLFLFFVLFLFGWLVVGWLVGWLVGWFVAFICFVFLIVCFYFVLVLLLLFFFVLFCFVLFNRLCF